jgi:CheY-like chemotaxis protein
LGPLFAGEWILRQSEKPRVLIVDDNLGNRMAFTALLEEDYEITLAADGREAIAAASTTEFAAIILDIRMPVMNGFDTAEVLRTMKRSRHTPILFTSAFEQNLDQLRRGFVAGATTFIISPVDRDLLKLKVAAFVRLFLRNQALRMQVEVLGSAVRSLHSELQRGGPVEEMVKRRMQDLEDVVTGLQDRVMP